jgi:hypothetical protein
VFIEAHLSRLRRRGWDVVAYEYGRQFELLESQASSIVRAMSLNELKTELAELPQKEQDQLAAYLVHLRHQRDAQIGSEMNARLDDTAPDHWISAAELREKWKD